MTPSRRAAFKLGSGCLVVAAAVLVAVSLILLSDPAHGAATGLSFEVETTSLPSVYGRVFEDPTASADEGLIIWSNATSSKAIKTPSSVSRILVRAKGDQCRGAPRMVVEVDGVQRFSALVDSTVWKGYAASIPSLPGGKHTVEVAFTNDYKELKVCDRNLRVDQITLTKKKTIALGDAFAGEVSPGIDQRTGLIGDKPAHTMFFRNWEEPGSREFPAESMGAVAARGAMPIVTWSPMDPALGTRQPEYALRAIARGDHDAYVRQWARDAAAWGRPFYLRPMHEMNGTWSPWGQGVNGNKRAEFVQAWRRMHRIFEQEGATNVRWVWSPAANVQLGFEKLYPGDAYVDWVALDGYNWGTLKSSGWRSLDKVFRPSYKVLARMTDKPMMIAETACAERGGDKAAWIRRGFLEELPERFPRVRAVTWFDRDKETNWRVNSSGASLKAYRQVAASPLYQGHLP